MVRKIDISTNPEFGIELALVIPYAYWLHQNGLLGKVTTSYGMRPFYFFHDEVIEEHQFRTIDNALAGMNSIPNNWIHHNAMAITGRDYNDLSEKEKESVNGVLDYSKWESPPYKSFYNELDTKENTIIISNKYNIEHGEKPLGYFDLECIYELVQYFSPRGYTIIYKRPNNLNTEFAYDQNELETSKGRFGLVGKSPLSNKEVTDYEFITELKKKNFNVKTMDEVVKQYGNIRYNVAQAYLFAKCSRFISVSGGNAILSSLWGGNVVVYVHKGKETRKGYFGDNSYFRKLSGANVYPSYDNDVCRTGVHNYDDLYNNVIKLV